MAPERDEHTEIPQLGPEPNSPVLDEDLAAAGPAPAGTGRGAGGRRRARESEPSVSAEEPPLERPDVTEKQLVAAFYWLYRGWCKVLGAEVDAHKSDFDDLGRAWLELARKVPGIRWVIAAAGPIFTFTDLLDKMAVAWSARTRLRQPFRTINWRQRSQQGAEAPDVHVVPGNGGTGPS